MARQYDNQGTPFKENWAEFLKAFKGDYREDGRNIVMAVLHEGLNVLVEANRAHSKVGVFIIMGLLFIAVGQTAKIVGGCG